MINLNVTPTTKGQFTVTNNINDREFYFVEKGGIFLEIDNDGRALTRVIDTFTKLIQHVKDRIVNKPGLLVHVVRNKHTSRPSYPIAIQADQVGASVDDFDLDDNEVTDVIDAALSGDLALWLRVSEIIRARGEEWLQDKTEKYENDLIDEDSARGDWEYEQEKDRRLNAAGE